MNENRSDAPQPLRRSGPSGHRPDGPNLTVLACVHGALVLLALGGGLLLADGQAYPSPLGEASAVVDYYRDHATAARLTAWLQFGAAVPLMIYAATAYARQLRLGVRVPGPVISLLGGVFAAGCLSLSALVMWALTFPQIDAGDGLIHTLALIVFATGGVGFATGAGLLIAGLAVPALILKFVPRWLAAAGLVLAACGEISFLSLIATPVAVVIPVVRFGGIAWLIAVAVLLPKRRAPANAATRSSRSTGGPHG